jgi:hypothetical protein
MEYQKITLHAQAYLVKFYEDFGFVWQGEMFLEAGIEHFYMEKNCLNYDFYKFLLYDSDKVGNRFHKKQKKFGSFKKK